MKKNGVLCTMYLCVLICVITIKGYHFYMIEPSLEEFRRDLNNES